MYRDFKIPLDIAILIQEACECYLPAETSFSRPTSGFYLTIFLPNTVMAKQVINLLKEKDVYVDDATRMFLPEYKNDHMLILSISQVNESQIKLGVKQIASCITFISSRKYRVTPQNFLRF